MGVVAFDPNEVLRLFDTLPSEKCHNIKWGAGKFRFTCVINFFKTSNQFPVQWKALVLYFRGKIEQNHNKCTLFWSHDLAYV